MEIILQAVGSVGFPIAVAAYLLVRLEQKLEGLATSRDMGTVPLSF